MRLLLLACVCLGLALACFSPNYRWQVERKEPLGADFLQEWVAGDMLLTGHARELYDASAFDQWQHSQGRVGFSWSRERYYPAVYPPSYYCLVAPLALLPYWLAVYIWLAVLLALYCLTAQLSSSTFTSASASTRATAFWLIGLFLPAMLFSLMVGQKGVVWLAILAGAMQLWGAQRPLAAGLVAGLLTLKPTLVLVLPLVMLLKGQVRFVIGFAVSAGLLVLLSLCVVPLSLWWDYLQVVLGTAGYQSHGGYRPGWSTSLVTLYQTLGLHGGWLLGAWLLSAISLLITLIMRGRGASEATGPLLPALPWLQIMISTALISPHFYFYDLVWLLAPLALVLRAAPPRAWIMIAVLWIGSSWAQHSEQSVPLLPPMLLGMWLLCWRWDDLCARRVIDSPCLAGPAEFHGALGLKATAAK